jgi:hypothetical protein
MAMRIVNRRQLLGSLGLTASVSLLAGCGESIHRSLLLEETATAGQTDNEPPKPKGNSNNLWQYVRLNPAAVAAEAYRQVPDGGCMYGLFAGIMKVMAENHGEPYKSFPIHMMKYGEGGVGIWGSLCGTLNGGAAIIGLFEQDKQRRENLIAQLFSWYETTELPSYQPKPTDESVEIPKTVANSVLCHASIGKWCFESGNEIGSQEMKERCRRLTAEVAAKTVELLNANLNEPCKFAGLSSEVKTCLSCHNKELHDTLGKMRCDSCHQQLLTKRSKCPELVHKGEKQSK